MFATRTASRTHSSRTIWKFALPVFLSLALLMAAGRTWKSMSVTVSAAPGAAATTTTLAVSSGGSAATSVASGSVVTLTATVLAGSTPVTIGQVNFCDATASFCSGTHLIGTAQMTSAGTAALKFVPPAGSHSYNAVFVGTGNDAASSSTASALTVTSAGGQAVTSSLAQSGSPGNVTLTDTVVGPVAGSASPAPTGIVSFVDTSNANAVLGSASLGTGLFGESWSNPQTPFVSLHPKIVLVGDVNGDGIPDIVSGGDGNVSILTGKGDGTFNAANNIAALASNPWIAMAPFVNGGPLDILAVSDAASNTNNALLITGNGSGGGTAGAPFSLPFGSASAVVSGDFNGDGQQDFAVIFQLDNKISTFLGNGNGTFQSPTTLATGSTPVSAVVGNFNGHGKIDVAVANSGDNTISIYLGSVAGTETANPFTVATPVPATFTPITIAVGDFNGDGIDDLAVTGTVSGNSVVGVFLGKGGGAFGTPTLIPQSPAAFGIVAADVLGNGKLDIVTTTATGSALNLFLNDGLGDFSQGAIPEQTVASPTFLAAGYFNGQANADLVVANTSLGALSIFVSNLTQTATASLNGVSGASIESLRAITGNVLPQSANDNIVAQYAGDANFAGSTSTPVVVSVTNPVPTISNLSPTTAGTSSGAFTLTVNGANFVNGAIVSFGGVNKTTAFVNFTQLTASILPSDIAGAGTPAVIVTNPTPGGGASNSVNFTVTASSNPVPTITTLSPNDINAGSGNFTLTVNGTNFVNASVVNFNGSPRTTSFVSATQLTAAILAGDITATGTPAITVTSPTPGGGTSNSVNLTVNPNISTTNTPPVVSFLPGITTYHSDAYRDGVNAQEYGLTTANVNTTAFGKKFSCATDAPIYGQPLYVANAAISGGIHNIMIVATMHNTVYAFDADISPCQTYWSMSAIPAGETFITGAPAGCGNYTTYGIIGTPVIDLTSNTVYVAAETVTSTGTPTYHSRIHAISLIDGSEKFGGAVDITGTSAGTTFNPLIQNQRPGLTLVNGVVYVAYSAFLGDCGNFYGWIFGYNASTLAQVAVFNDAPGGTTSQGAGIWMSGGAPAFDTSNNLYLATGNGVFDGASNWGDSFLKFATTGGLSVSSFFAPDNQATLEAGGNDLGSGGVVLFDSPTSTSPRLMIGAGKQGIAYLVNRDSLGGFNASNNNGALQNFSLGTGAVMSTPAFWNDTMYIVTQTTGQGLSTYAFNPGTGLFTTTAGSHTAATFTCSCGTPSISASGATNGIVWVIGPGTGSEALLHAYDATNLATELWNSSMIAGDKAGGRIEFTVPTIAGGKVFIGTQTEVDVYGLAQLPTITTPLIPATSPAGATGFTLTVNGTGFVNGSVVYFNGNPRTTSFVSATQLTATILATDVAASGTPTVVVANPAPAGGLSNWVNFSVTAASNPVPAITSLSPTSATAGSATFTLMVNGTGFVSGATVSFGGANKTTTFVNSTQLTAAILAADVASVGTPAVVVTTPTPGGGASNSVNFSVTAASNPVPTISNISPANAAAGSGAFTLMVTGTNFISSSSVLFNGTARATTFVSATQLTAAILATDVASTGTPTVVVSNPTPGGGQSNSVTFTITAASNPVPTVTSLSPTSVAAGSAGFTLTVTGTNFVSGAFINFAGTNRLTTFVSSTQLTTAITAADVATTGTPAVLVNNPTPGGGASNSINFSVTAAANPVPTVTTISPTSIAAGSSAFTLTVNGTNFVSNSVIHFNGQIQATTFVNSTQLTTTVQSLEVETAGTPAVNVVNPTPGGGTSNSATFTISGTTNPVPTITALSPTNISAGSAPFTLTVTGTNFVSTSVVDWIGAPQPTTFVSATTLTASISAADIQFFNQSVPVIVVNPAPGGGTSNTFFFNVTTPVAVLSTLVPNSAIAGGAAFTLTVNGSNIENNAVVQWNGANLVTTFVSATQLTAAVPATDIASVGTASVVVFNPLPSGGGASGIRTQGAPAGTSSNTLMFTISAANPVPTITTLSPNNKSAGSGAFTLTVNGTNFISSSVVQWNGSPRTTTFVGATQLTAAITAADIQTANLYLVSVVNPTPGGGTSNVVTFTATTPIPALTSLAPNSAIAGGAAFTLTLNGSNFINTSVAQWNGSNRATTFVSATQLTAAITAADIATAGSASVQVFTPTVVFSGANARAQGLPSGVTSNALTFTITAPNPVPTLTAISPTLTGAGGAAFTMTLTGTNFISGSTAQWKGSARVTTFVSATSLTAAITAADIASSGTAAITVVNPTPGGGTSNALTFTITDFSVSATTTTQTVTAGSSANFTIATATVGGAFPGTVTFTASGLPTGASASFSPASVTAGTSTTMTITTTARGLAQINIPPSNVPSTTPNNSARPMWIFTLAMLLTLMTALMFALANAAKFGRRTTRRLVPIGAFALLLISVGYISGCSGGGFPKVGSGGTPAGTYTVTVTGTSGADVHTTTVTLIVQ